MRSRIFFFFSFLFVCFFSHSSLCFAVGPSIEWVRVYPTAVPPDGKTRVAIFAKLSHPQGLQSIKQVVVNLGPIGGFGNSKMGDDGWLGDERANDGIYTILASVAKGASFGRKTLVVTAFDQSGWRTFQEGGLDVVDAPSILSVSASRDRVPADGRTPLLLTAKLFNASGLWRVKYVLVDLTDVGGGKRVLMRNDGRGEDAAADEWWSYKTVVPRTVPPGWKVLRITAMNDTNGFSVKDVSIFITK